MKRLSVIALLAFTAAGMPAAAHAQTAYNWTGFYIGGNAGYGWGQNRDTATPLPFGNAPAFNAQILTTTMKPTGGLIGPQAGYNYQWTQWIFGVETDLDYAGLNDSKQGGPLSSIVPGTPLIGSFHNVSQNIDVLGTLRLRAGYALDHLLIFGTGGLGFGHVKDNAFTQLLAIPTTQFATSTSSWKAGWAAGAGAEYAFADNLSVKVEYLHFDLGDETITASPRAANPPFTVQDRIGTSGNVLRIGLNYRFGVPTPPPPVAAPPAPPPAAVAPQKQVFIVFFEFDKSSLTADGKKVVDAAAAAFKSGKSGVAIAGYTDLAGTQQYNLALSKRRADTVKAALVRDGIPAAAIDAKWFGKQNPRVPTADGVREPQNRRVEITM